MKCLIVVCKTHATWEGEIKSVATGYSQPVRYCDGHASMLQLQVAQSKGLTIVLEPIGQKEKKS